MDGSDANTVKAALADIWERNLPLIRERVTAIEQAAAELAKPSPNADRIAHGQAEAHKLAGVLGSFGLSRGTELARSLEGDLGAERGGDAKELVRAAAELRSVIEGSRAEDSGPH
jgi:HPt (histidine-containing phosphotransfer) domain-containing protein